MGSPPTSGDGAKDLGRRRQHWQRMYSVTAAAIALMLALVRVTIAAADNTGIPRVAFFGFQLINTSLDAGRGRTHQNAG